MVYMGCLKDKPVRPLKMTLIGSFNRAVRLQMPCGKDPGEMFKKLMCVNEC